jgi:hypothetical protein
VAGVSIRLIVALPLFVAADVIVMPRPALLHPVHDGGATVYLAGIL